MTHERIVYPEQPTVPAGTAIVPLGEPVTIVLVHEPAADLARRVTEVLRAQLQRGHR